jgi:hypothetical protein
VAKAHWRSEALRNPSRQPKRLTNSQRRQVGPESHAIRPAWPKAAPTWPRTARSSSLLAECSRVLRGRGRFRYVLEGWLVAYVGLVFIFEMSIPLHNL